MKKIFLLILVFTLLTTPVLAQEGFSDVAYQSNENADCIMSDGYSYIGYKGMFEFNASFQTAADETGCVLRKAHDDSLSETESYADIYLRCVYYNGKYRVKFSGHGLRSGSYSLIPYVRHGETYTYGDEYPFEISENCEIMTNLRIVYDKIDEPDFSDKQQEFVDLVLPAISETIAAGNSGTLITEDYIKNNHADVVDKAIPMSEKFNKAEKHAFLKLFGDTGSKAILRILKLFGISF